MKQIPQKNRYISIILKRKQSHTEVYRMILEMKEYRKKLMGCWMGKNIGGTLGAPFEAKRQVNDVSFYVQDLAGNPPANDDLDLQLVWLNAVEKYGKNVNARILGEYWLSYITPHWVEYGAGKTNMRMGLVPPLSGYANNPYRDSCGCFIRSEIWASLAPGHPEIAVKYAYEDAIVDHADEGLYGEIFCAAVESAAFVETDKYKLIDIGLSYIPEDCGVAKGIKTAIASYQSGTSWVDARKNVLTAVPGTFGTLGTPVDQLPKDIPVGERGWDAPSNIAIMIIGWLYGEEDFGKSLCIAVNCGEDTDCTAATLGSILGIISGIDGIPQNWIEPMGEKINTLCIDYVDGNVILPQNVSELTDRILKAAPIFLGSDLCDFINTSNGYTVSTLEKEALFCKPAVWNPWKTENFVESLKQGTFAVKYDFTIFNAALDYTEEPFIKANTPKRFKLVLENNIGRQQWLNVIWHIPEGWKITPAQDMCLYLDHSFIGKTVMEYTLEAECLNKSRYDLIVEISSNGRHTKGLIPVVLLHGK